MRRRLLLLGAVVLLALTGVTAIVWKARDWPPPGLVVEYGLPSSQGPTGRTRDVEGFEFAEIAPGYFRSGSHAGCDPGDLPGRVCALVGLPFGDQPSHHGRDCPPRRVVVDHTFWITPRMLNLSRLCAVVPPDELESMEARTRPLDLPGFYRELQAWFCAKTGLDLREPTAIEWEYAVRTGVIDARCPPEEVQLRRRFARLEYAAFTPRGD